jgi:hypothetical protein
MRKRRVIELNQLPVFVFLETATAVLHFNHYSIFDIISIKITSSLEQFRIITV